MTAIAADNEIISERMLSATPAQIFAAYRDPQRLARWWGPNGFSSTFHEFEFRAGGQWKFTLRGPDGVDYYNESEFVELVEPTRVVLDHLRPMHRFRMTMTFTPEAGGTRIMWRMEFETADEVARIKSFVLDANQQNFDRLAAELAEQA